jgi:hypothetical protein
LVLPFYFPFSTFFMKQQLMAFFMLNRSPGDTHNYLSINFCTLSVNWKYLLSWLISWHMYKLKLTWKGLLYFR